MKAFLGLRAAVVLLLLTAAGTGAAQAQRYDGGGLLKFGVFGQGTFLDFGINQPVAGSVSSNGLGVGVSFGFDVTSYGGWLWGLEADGSLGDARGISVGTSYGFDYMLSLRARLGHYVHPSVLLYGTAGVAFLGFEAQQPAAGSKAYETLTGITAGGGLEYDWHHVLVFTEYLYAGFDSRQFNINNVRHEADADAHLVRLGIKFKIGHDHYHGVSRDRGYEPLK
jgi:outer membrane immunogenic protein